MAIDAASRRPLKVRDKAWAHSLASFMVARRVTPNAISLLSVCFGAAAGVFLFVWQRFDAAGGVALLVSAAAAIQLRLICNLIDGMVAVEGKMGTKSGEVFNDMPDRFADLMILVGAGYGLTWPWAIMTLACLLAAVETVLLNTEYVLIAALAVIALGSLYTTLSRAASVVQGLENK